MIKAYLIHVLGKVQRVGYRRHILDSAQETGLTGYIKNLPDGSVEIFIQGEEKKILKFLETMKQPPPIVKIRETKKKEAQIKPEIKRFKIIYGELADELQEGFGAMQNTFMEYWKEFRNYREEFRGFAKGTDENFRILMEKYGEISKKLTEILETLVKESKETRETLNENIKLLRKAIDKLSK